MPREGGGPTWSWRRTLAEKANHRLGNRGLFSECCGHQIGANCDDVLARGGGHVMEGIPPLFGDKWADLSRPDGRAVFVTVLERG